MQNNCKRLLSLCNGNIKETEENIIYKYKYPHSLCKLWQWHRCHIASFDVVTSKISSINNQIHGHSILSLCKSKIYLKSLSLIWVCGATIGIRILLFTNSDPKVTYMLWCWHRCARKKRPLSTLCSL